MPDTSLSALCYYLNCQTHPVRHVLLLYQMRKLRDKKIEELAQDHRGMQQWGPDHDMNTQNSKVEKSTLEYPVLSKCFWHTTYILVTLTWSRYTMVLACLYLSTGCLFARQPFSSIGRFVLSPHFPFYDVFFWFPGQRWSLLPLLLMQSLKPTRLWLWC